MENTVKFPKYDFGKRLRSMLRVDFKRMFKSKLFYILIACALVIPILITVMMTLMNVLLCLAGGLLFAVGLGVISKTVLKKTSLV